MFNKIKIKVIPRSSCNEIIGKMSDGVLKIKLTAAPVDGEANNALIKFLSKELDIAKSKIEIVRGKNGKNKILKISE